MKISIFGLGYVGAVSCGCLAELGHDVIGVDVIAEKVQRIGRGESPIVEPGMDELLMKAFKEGRLKATTSVRDAVAQSDVGLVCVGTPSNATGGVDTRYLEAVCNEIGAAVHELNKPNFTVMNRSTSLPAVHRALIEILAKASKRKMGSGIGYVCHPEFLREGIAVQDFHKPPKIVFGASDPVSEKACRELYPTIEAETFFTTVEVASMVKYADNCFHAVKVTFGNEIGLICKACGIDSHAVMEIFCRDRKLNISDKYLRPGNPFGGSCLPKDLRGILDASRTFATPLHMLGGMLESNRLQVDRLIKRVVTMGGRDPVGLVGLAFKEGTDDVRESSMVYMVEQLIGKGIPIKIYDGHLAVQAMIGRNKSFALQSIPHLADLLTDNLASVIAGSRTVIINHRLSPEKWKTAGLGANHRILDLVGIPELKSMANYDGLYW